jgi:hypothetical protein
MYPTPKTISENAPKNIEKDVFWINQALVLF